MSLRTLKGSATTKTIGYYIIMFAPILKSLVGKNSRVSITMKGGGALFSGDVEKVDNGMATIGMGASHAAYDVLIDTSEIAAVQLAGKSKTILP